VGVQKVRWEGGGTKPAGEYTFFYGKANENHELGTVYYVRNRIISAIKRVEFVSHWKTPWPESASELYQPSDSRLSAKLVPNFADVGCRVVSAMDSHGRSFGFLDRSSYFYFQVAPQLYSRGRVDPEHICYVNTFMRKARVSKLVLNHESFEF
jgi:hypothetical protein